MKRREWSRVDSSRDQAQFVEYLRRASALPVVREYKQRTFSLLRLRPGASVVDVGCGRGDDAVALARVVGSDGRAVGVDSSSVMLEVASAAAREAGVSLELVLADATALPFAGETFDACRIDRTLQHLDDPDAAVRELVRACRGGGRVVAVEPDWDTLVVDAPDLDTTRAVVRGQSDEIAHGTIGRSLRRMFVTSGLRDVSVEHVALSFDELEIGETAFGLSAGLRRAVDRGWVEAPRADAWWRSLEDADAAGTFWTSVVCVLAAGTKA